MKLKPVLRVGALAFVLVLGAGATVASAQQAAPAANPPAAGQPPMVLPVITPSHLAAAREVVIASGLSRSFDTIVPSLMSELFGTVTQTRPELAPDLKIVLNQLQPEFQKQTSQIIDAAAQAVAAQLDEADLKQTAAFFNSPAGQKYVDAQPAMLDHMMTYVHAITEQMSQQMMTRVREEMKKRGKEM